MTNIYKNNQQSVESMISTINQNIFDYELKITDLKNLINEIKESTSWIDDSLKPDFINTCNAFLEVYQKTIEALKTNMKYMQCKCRAVSSLNSAYKG